jgi:hypothetical protein
MVVNVIIPNPDFPSNPPAFPTATLAQKTEGGMTLRDYFAAKAMQGLLANAECQLKPWDEVPQASYKMADVMLKAREE